MSWILQYNVASCERLHSNSMRMGCFLCGAEDVMVLAVKTCAQMNASSLLQLSAVNERRSLLLHAFIIQGIFLLKRKPTAN